MTDCYRTPRFEDILAFMRERQAIYVRRKAGRPYPWTQDPVLGSGHFCNIFRELDRVTIWVRKNIREPFADHPNLWIMLALARYINWPPTLQALMDYNSWPSRDTWRPSDVTASLEHLAAKGEKVYTGAYMIRAESDPKKEWYSWTKHRYIAEVVIGRLWERREQWVQLLEKQNRPNDYLRLEEAWAYFQSPFFVGWGPFMAYEVVTDLRHTRYLRNAPDIYTWANAGPGAIRGLNRLNGRPLKAHPPSVQTNEEMHALMGDLNRHMAAASDLRELFCPGAQAGDLVFEMRDVEHTLCEFDKYERVRLGEGQMRSHYDPKRSHPLT